LIEFGTKHLNLANDLVSCRLDRHTGLRHRREKNKRLTCAQALHHAEVFFDRRTSGRCERTVLFETHAVESDRPQDTLSAHSLESCGELDFGDGKSVTEMKGAIHILQAEGMNRQRCVI
jgi:hypothetical protein